VLAAGLGVLILGASVRASAQSGYRLGTGDKLKVTVFGEEDASGEYEIDATGSISARLIGRVQVKGLTVSEVGRSSSLARWRSVANTPT
jgi:protein involved in polysaccharide export with SLBB domain